MKVLIVEDNDVDRLYLRYSFEGRGWEVSEAGDGLAGLDLAGRIRPDLIISDAMMPRLDGFQFLRTLKTDGDLSPVPFVFYSAVYTGPRRSIWPLPSAPKRSSSNPRIPPTSGSMCAWSLMK